jgi:hypothetical protein
MGPEGVLIPASFSIPPSAEESDLWTSHAEESIGCCLLFLVEKALNTSANSVSRYSRQGRTHNFFGYFRKQGE